MCSSDLDAEDGGLDVVTIRKLSDLVERFGTAEMDAIPIRERKAR